MRTNVLATLAVTVVLGLSLSACHDTKARGENQRLKTQVTALQPENADLSAYADPICKRGKHFFPRTRGTSRLT